ncbi:MAG: hypothetical protein AcusKO_39500 [Acuticoccus sp.]
MSGPNPTILIWVEPHPIRNLFDSFTKNVIFLADALQAGFGGAVDVRLSASEIACASILSLRPDLEPRMIALSPAENEAVRANFRRWDDAAIEDWVAIVRGERRNPVLFDLYRSIIDRLLDETPFDLVMTWSDNRLVRGGAEARGIPVLSGELGPTRGGFGETFYVDPSGTNGFAAIRDFPMALADGYEALSPETWPAMARASVSGLDGVTEPGVMELARYRGEDFALPVGPYVFVPLQLADDLNTLLHSPFRSPLAFLQHVVPLCRSAGYEVVVKGHPGVSGGQRPQNLVAEQQALTYAASVEGVHLLPRGAPASATIPVVGNASAVLTINSSMGFEALLLGRPVATFGDAAFDIGDRLKRDAAAPVDAVLAPTDLSRECAVLLRHYLHPYDPLEGGRSLRHIVMLSLDRSLAPLSHDYWQRWVAAIDHAGEEIDRIQSMADPQYIGRAIAAGDLDVIRAHGAFKGHVDKVDVAEQDGARHVKAAGWVTTQNHTGDVLAVSLMAGGSIITTTQRLIPSNAIAGKIGATDPVYRFGLDVTLDPAERRPLALSFLSRAGALEAQALRQGSFGLGNAYYTSTQLEREFADPAGRRATFEGAIDSLHVEATDDGFDVRVGGTVNGCRPRGGPVVVALFAGGRLLALSASAAWHTTAARLPRTFELDARARWQNDSALELAVFDGEANYEIYQLAEGPLRRSTLRDVVASLPLPEAGERPRFIGHLERVRHGRGTSEGLFSLRGWVHGAGSDSMVQAVLVALGGRLVATSNLFARREDVAASHELADDRCGIRMAFPMRVRRIGRGDGRRHRLPTATPRRTRSPAAASAPASDDAAPPPRDVFRATAAPARGKTLRQKIAGVASLLGRPVSGGG